MAKNKTIQTQNSVTDFINTVADITKRNDCYSLAGLITAQTELLAKMWGTAIVGFGSYNYKYESGHEGNAPLIGFSPRVNALVLYLSTNFEQRDELLPQLGKQGK